MPERKRKTFAPRESDGALCAAFANTASDQRQSPSNYAEWLAWFERHNLLTASERQRLQELAARQPVEARAAFALFERLRSHLSWIFTEWVDHTAVSPEVLEAFNKLLAETLPPRQLVARRGGGFHLAWAAGYEENLDRPLWAVINSVLDLLASKQVSRIRRCAGEDCDLFFVVRNSGVPQRWCSMKACGKKVKSRRYYKRVVKPGRERYDRRPRG